MHSLLFLIFQENSGHISSQIYASIIFKFKSEIYIHNNIVRQLGLKLFEVSFLSYHPLQNCNVLYIQMNIGIIILYKSIMETEYV